jgi:hypothetical protein
MIIRNHKPKTFQLTKEQVASLQQDQPKPIGLGDRVERIAQPIARVIDKVAGTNIQGCGACQKRKEWLNNITLKQD